MVGDPQFIAHSRPSDGGQGTEFHELDAHLLKVAKRAASYGEAFRAAPWLYLAGLWHDLGKYRPGFQQYIRQVLDAHIEGRVQDSSKTHSTAGALWAEQVLRERMGPQGQVLSRILQYLIAGHHAGLDNWDADSHGEGLFARLSKPQAMAELQEALRECPTDSILHPGIDEWPVMSTVPSDQKGDIPGRFALWVRMLFSCLVDADFLDTEMFMNPEKSEARSGAEDLAPLLAKLDGYMAEKVAQVAANGLEETTVNVQRQQVLKQCREKALLQPGAYSLTVPTGGGKTLSSLAFALTHAARHQKRRVVYAIPYTSIIEQTAEIFRGILGDDHVVEHHSNAEAAPEKETHRSRLACENWDAPVIVTTNVQLFESLFARRTSRCRKLHNLVNSVLVLDEAQLLPIDFLQPVLDVLRLLIKDYGVTVVFCTATQPVLTEQRLFDVKRGLRGFAPGEVTEIVDDVAGLYQALRRVQVHLPESLDQAQTWPALADRMARDEAMLAIVNRRADARELYELLKRKMDTDAEGLWHLSALMCPQHRSDVLADIKSALVARRQARSEGRVPLPVRIVSTQLVECGVDISLPVVWRASAGLDSVAQAAGRCNREGELASGDVHVFVPPTKAPPGQMRQAIETCRTVWNDRPADPLAIELFDVYFRKLYGDAPSLDKHDVVGALRMQTDKEQRALPVRFRDAAEFFKLIDNEDAATVIVRYRSAHSSENIDALIAKLEKEGPQRWLMRKLQRYGVTLYRNDVDRLLALGDVREMGGVPGLYVQASDLFYDPVLGANAKGAPGDPAMYVVN